MTFQEAAAETLRLADTIRAYWDRELPKNHRDYPFVSPGEPEVPPPPEKEELRRFLDSLDTETVLALAAVMDLGLWDDGPDRLAEKLREAAAAQMSRERATLLLAERTMMAYYLRRGLDRLRGSGLDAREVLESSAATAA